MHESTVPQSLNEDTDWAEEDEVQSSLGFEFYAIFLSFLNFFVIFLTSLFLYCFGPIFLNLFVPDIF